MASRYTLGHTPASAERLRYVAAIADEQTRFLLENLTIDEPPALVVDLGCGPGYTTRLLAETLRPDRTVGLDVAESFLEVARQSSHEGLEYRRHDLLEGELPVSDADVVFTRFLLSHLPRPTSHLGTWSRALALGGRLILVEVERVNSPDAVFTDYLAMLDGLLRSQGGVFSVGPVLAEAERPEDMTTELDRVATFDVPASLAGRSFHLNLQNVRNDPYVLDEVGPERVDRIDRGLASLAEGTRTTTITWQLRQLVLRRTG
ncbi:MAG: class I SAM-dependent methyltransferase [Actinomycetota bacterium]